MGVGPEARVGMADQRRQPALEPGRRLHPIGRGRLHGLSRRVALEPGAAAREGGKPILTWPGRAIGRGAGETEPGQRARRDPGGGPGAHTAGRRTGLNMTTWTRFSDWLA